MGFLVFIICIFAGAFELSEFFRDYKRERFYIASLELVCAIMIVICGACMMCKDILM